MEETKVIYHGETEFNEPQHPPPYSSGPPADSYISQQPGPHDYSYGTGVSMVHASTVGMGMGVVGTQVGVVGTNIGVVGTNVGVVGTNVGVVGTNVGIVGVNVPVIVSQQISPKPTRITCRSCNNVIVTRVESKPTWKTHFFAGVLCLMGCWCCVCIPYCTDSCLNNDHYCPNCNAYIGSYVT